MRALNRSESIHRPAALRRHRTGKRNGRRRRPRRSDVCHAGSRNWRKNNWLRKQIILQRGSALTELPIYQGVGEAQGVFMTQTHPQILRTGPLQQALQRICGARQKQESDCDRHWDVSCSALFGRSPVYIEQQQKLRKQLNYEGFFLSSTVLSQIAAPETEVSWWGGLNGYAAIPRIW